MCSAWDLLIEIYSQKIKSTACLLLEIVLDFIFQNIISYEKHNKVPKFVELYDLSRGPTFPDFEYILNKEKR